MRRIIAVLMVVALSGCGAATGTQTGDTTSGTATGSATASSATASSATSSSAGGATSSSASGATSSSASGGITVNEPWVRAAILLGDAAASGMAMEASAAAEMSADASATGEGMAMGQDMAMDGAVSAGYMTLRNDDTEADRLVGASSDIAGEVQLHTSEMKDNVMSMRQVEAIDVPPSGTVALEPGGFHLMLLDIKRELKAGETVKLTLQFERAGTVEIDATVREAGSE